MKKLLSLALCLVLACGLFSFLPVEAEEAGGTDLFATAVWNPGAYYDGSVNTALSSTRRYTVLDCSAGQTFTFARPSTKWRVYVYYADASGSIEGKYFEVADGMTYTVSPINGRTPTALRVTACPNPDGTITDATWATFDVRCTATGGSTAAPANNVFATAEWKLGAYYDGSVNTSIGNKRRYTVIECQAGQTYTFDHASSDWQIWVYPADASGSIGGLYFEATDGLSYTVRSLSGRTPTTLRITACPKPDGNITDEMWASFDVSCTVTSGKDVLATAEWQPGAYYDGAVNTALSGTRRYTVLSCTEGQTYTFKLPSSNWQIWVYYADAAGSIEGKYFEAKNGTTCTISPINGRVPTQLRITACPQPVDSTVITDKMWMMFDVSCTVVNPPDGKEVLASATWAPGAYYDKDVNTALGDRRRYTVIDCEEGQLLTFKLPSSKWQLWVYPADANGSIGGNYFEAKEGTTYTVRAINGRIPTKLRITVCPKPDGTLTDAMFSEFDARCYVTTAPAGAVANYDIFRTADWKLGAYYGNAVHGGGDRRHAIFSCKEGDTFKFDFGSQTYGLWIYYYDEKGEISDFGYTELKKNGTVKVEKKNGKVPTELRISVFPIAGGNITSEMWNDFDISCTKSSDYIKVATMNYGLFNDGITKGVENSKVDTVLAAWKKMLDDNDVDVLAGQEWIPYFDRNNTMTAEECLFAYKYRYQFTTTTGNGKHLATKAPCTDYTVNSFVNDSARQYTKAYATINGKKVCLINAHCSFETDFATSNRKLQYQELINVMNKEEYVIVFGDFNAWSVDEFKTFTDAGYSVANGGEFGSFNTWTDFDKPSYWTNRAIDNIIVSSNIDILGVKVDRRDLSDHSMLVAEIQLLEKAPTGGTDSTDGEPGYTGGSTGNNGGSTATGGTNDTTDVTDTTDATDGTSGSTNATDSATAGATSGKDTPPDTSDRSFLAWIVCGIAAVATAFGVWFFWKKKKIA